MRASMAINTKATPASTDASPEQQKPADDRLMIADLSFEHQVVVWALRTYLARRNGTLRVQAQFYRALPPAAARIAFEALREIVETLQRHGTRPLVFSTLSTGAVSRDEFLLLSLLCAVVEEPPSDVSVRAGWLVGERARGRLISV